MRWNFLEYGEPDFSQLFSNILAIKQPVHIMLVDGKGEVGIGRIETTPPTISAFKAPSA